ncbi:BTAD domain-containing putative transcriptional regulator [Planomonospora algeriensis]
MTKGWGFPARAVVVSTLSSGVWNTLFRFVLPAVGILALLASGKALSPAVVQAGWAGALSILVLVSVAGAALYWDRAAALLGRALDALTRLAPSAVRPGEHAASAALERLRADTSAVVRTRWRGLTLGMVSFLGLQWLVLVCCLHATGAYPGLAQSIAAFALSRVLTTALVTPSGTGIMEAGTIGALVFFGVPADSATAAALLFGFWTYTVEIPFGGLALGAWALLRRREGAQAAPAEEPAGRRGAADPAPAGPTGTPGCQHLPDGEKPCARFEGTHSVTADMVAFRVLGPVEAYSGDNGGDDGLDLGGLRQRAVLARLLVARGQVVPVDTLLYDLWDDDAAKGAQSGLQVYISRLRRVLEPGRPRGGPNRLLVTVASGYALRVAPDQVDALRFESLVRAAGEQLEGDDPASARVRLEKALGMWRGTPYSEFADQPWAEAEVNRLTELRLVARERHADSGLRLGMPSEAVPDLEALTTEHPLREEGWRLLALGLYRCGRQGDALAALRRARTILADELGIDPGPALRKLESDILSQDPGLELPVPQGRQRPVVPADTWPPRPAAAGPGRAAAAGARAVRGPRRRAGAADHGRGPDRPLHRRGDQR